MARANNLFTFAAPAWASRDEVFFSACFFIWFAGIYRTGDPGIHRPYNPAGLAGRSLDQAQNYYARAHRRTREYIDEMDLYGELPSTFIATMFSTPPEKVRFLSTVQGVSSTITDTYLPHIEQLLLDTCGSLDNADCLRNTLLSNK